ncbi:MAG: hypothetical protein ABSB63_02145 [Spirochaetia bacterium]
MKKISGRAALVGIASAVGLLAGILGIYTFFFESKRTELSFEILSRVNPFDFKAPLPDAKVIIKGEDILANGKKITIVDVRCLNSGNTDILISSYDPGFPIGLDFSDSTLLRPPELTEASSDYLMKRVRIQVDAGNQVSISPVILDKGSFFKLRLYLLHSGNQTPVIAPFGKIAGQSTILLRENTPAPKSESTFSLSFQGNVVIQIIRIFGYALAFIIIVIAFSFSIAGLAGLFKRLQRRSTISKFKRESKRRFRVADDPIFKEYFREGSSLFTSIKEVTQLKADLKEDDGLGSYMGSRKPFRKVGKSAYVGPNIVKKMRGMGLARVEHGSVLVIRARRKTFELFYNFLRKMGKIEERGFDREFVVSADRFLEASLETEKLGEEIRNSKK